MEPRALPFTSLQISLNFTLDNFCRSVFGVFEVRLSGVQSFLSCVMNSFLVLCFKYTGFPFTFFFFNSLGAAGEKSYLSVVWGVYFCKGFILKPIQICTKVAEKDTGSCLPAVAKTMHPKSVAVCLLWVCSSHPYLSTEVLSAKLMLSEG